MTNDPLPTASDGTPYIPDELIALNPHLVAMIAEQQSHWAYDAPRQTWFGPTPSAPPPTRRTDYGRDE